MARTGCSYLPHTGTKVFAPYVPIKIAKDPKSVYLEVDALVDSGADSNLFPLQIGEYLGINFNKLKSQTLYGIGNHYVKTYRAAVTIWLGRDRYSTVADFCTHQPIAILGRKGFFDLFKSIIFDEKGRFIYIESA